MRGKLNLERPVLTLDGYRWLEYEKYFHEINVYYDESIYVVRSLDSDHNVQNVSSLKSGLGSMFNLIRTGGARLAQHTPGLYGLRIHRKRTNLSRV